MRIARTALVALSRSQAITWRTPSSRKECDSGCTRRQQAQRPKSPIREIMNRANTKRLEHHRDTGSDGDDRREGQADERTSTGEDAASAAGGGTAAGGLSSAAGAGRLGRRATLAAGSGGTRASRSGTGRRSAGGDTGGVDGKETVGDRRSGHAVRRRRGERGGGRGDGGADSERNRGAVAGVDAGYVAMSVNRTS
jgi:hypothetical protein